MRRSDYNLVAQTLAQALNECRREPISGVMLTIEQFCDNLSIDNRNFSKVQLVDSVAACTVSERGRIALAKLKDKYTLVDVVEF